MISLVQLTHVRPCQNRKQWSLLVWVERKKTAQASISLFLSLLQQTELQAADSPPPVENREKLPLSLGSVQQETEQSLCSQFARKQAVKPPRIPRLSLGGRSKGRNNRFTFSLLLEAKTQAQGDSLSHFWSKPKTAGPNRGGTLFGSLCLSLSDLLDTAASSPFPFSGSGGKLRADESQTLSHCFLSHGG